MKRRLKILLGAAMLFIASITLSGCTASFCNTTDLANILYAYDFGVTNYFDTQTEEAQNLAYYYEAETHKKVEIPGVYYSADKSFCSTLADIETTISNNAYGIVAPDVEFYEALDAVVLGHALAKEPGYVIESADSIRRPVKEDGTFDTSKDKGILDKYGYLKFEDDTHDNTNDKVLFTNWYSYIEEVRSVIGVDPCPTSDYISIYYTTMNSYATNSRSCLATETGDYGAYGPRKIAVSIEGKKWTDWKGLLEFIFIWPIGALIDVLTKGMLGAKMIDGAAQILAIFIVTIIIRSLMLLVTFKQTQSSAKMTELQPEIQKIQAKYPNSNTNQYDKQRMAADMQKLYKKHHINPLTSLLVMIVQFPVFICVWGAMQGSAYLSSGTFLGLRLSDSIGTTLFTASNWSNGSAVTALILFILMAASQTISMLLPQWMQKAKAKKVARLGRNPAQKSQDNKMKWVTYIMLIMVILMGFSLASGMGVYWFVGALFSIAQTLITQKITSRKKYSKKGN